MKSPGPKFNPSSKISSDAFHAWRSRTPWELPEPTHKMDEHPNDLLAVKLNDLYDEIAGRGAKEDLQHHGRRMMQMLNDVSHLSKEEAERGGDLCEDMLNLAFSFQRLLEYPESLCKAQEHTSKTREFYASTIKARGLITGEWVRLAHEIGDALRTRRNNVMSRLDPLEVRLDRVIELGLVLSLGLMYPHKMAKYFATQQTSWLDTALALPDHQDFSAIQREAFRDLNDKLNELKDQAKNMIVDAAHIEHTLSVEVPSQLLDPLFDLLLEEFDETKNSIDRMQNELHEMSTKVSEAMIYEHAGIWKRLDMVSKDIQKFRGKIKDKSAYQGVAAKLAKDGHDSIGAYLVDMYTGDQPCECPCCRSRKAIPQKLTPEQTIAYTYAIDSCLGTLPPVPDRGRRMVDQLLRIHQRMRRKCWNSILRIDDMLYNSNLSFRARTLLRAKTVTIRMVPLLTYSEKELKGLRDPALRHILYRRLTPAVFERHKEWLRYMGGFGSWAISYVKDQTNKAGRLQLSAEQKAKVLAGLSDVPGGCLRRLQAGEKVNEEGALSEDDSATEHHDNRQKPRKGKRKARVGKKHK